MANIGRALPSYALVVMILPISLTLSPEYGLDPIPTFVAMTLLAIPAILIGAYAGLRAVDRDLLEAGRGMGLRERQILTQLELPVATPVIVGGFRTATLQVIATATIGAIVSGGGLGRFIVDGIHNQDFTMVIAGRDPRRHAGDLRRPHPRHRPAAPDAARAAGRSGTPGGAAGRGPADATAGDHLSTALLRQRQGSAWMLVP